MVATLVRLRFLLLFNGLKKSPLQLVAVVFGALYGLGILALVIAGLVGLRFATIEVARPIVVLAGALVIVSWTLLPVLTVGLDQTVDPARLATFPIPINQLIIALAVSGVLGVPGIVTSLAALSTVVTWSRDPLAVFAALVSAVIGVLTAVIGSRMVGAIASRVGGGRRSREVRGLLVIIPLVLLGPIAFVVTSALRDVADLLPTIANVVSWTPFGAIWAVPADVASDDLGNAGLRFLIGVATLIAFVLLWRWGLARALETPARPATGQAVRGGAGFFGLFPGTPAGAVAARALTYWMRDPRYAQSLITVPLVPALLFFYAGALGSPGILIWVGPIMALLLSLSIYTDVSYDNTAFALHLKTGVSGRDDRVGRVWALAVFAAPVCVALAVAGVWVAGSWTQLPGLLGITLGALLTGFAVSSAISARFTFAVPAPGDSPFKARPGGGFSLTVSTFATWGALGILILPELVLALLGWATDSLLLGWLSLAVGLGLGSTLLVVAIRLGGRIMDDRGPELLTSLMAQK